MLSTKKKESFRKKGLAKMARHKEVLESCNKILKLTSANFAQVQPGECASNLCKRKGELTFLTSKFLLMFCASKELKIGDIILMHAQPGMNINVSFVFKFTYIILHKFYRIKLLCPCIPFTGFAPL